MWIFVQDICIQFVRGENYLKLLIESLNLELRSVNNVVMDVTIKEAELESLAGILHVKLGMGKSELEACAAEDLRLRSSCSELTSVISKLSNESECARQEAQRANVEIGLLRNEKEAYKATVFNQMKLLSEQTNSARSSLSSSSTKLMLSKQEYDSLKHKAIESNTLAEMKVAAEMAQVEAILASENEFITRLHLAMKKVAMSEAAKAALEGEPCRLREFKLRKGDKLFSEWSPEHHKTVSLEKILGETWKAQNGGATLSKRALSPNTSSILHGKQTGG